MRDYTKFYINGAWVAPSGSDTLTVENPATLEQCGTIAIGNEVDVDTAVAAAKAAFETFSQTSVVERAARLDKIAEIYMSRIGEIAEAIREEMGAPISHYITGERDLCYDGCSVGSTATLQGCPQS